MTKILAGIVLYNPDIERLRQNVGAIAPQADAVLLVDNGSGNIAAVEQAFTPPHILTIVKNEANLGIATALNQVLRYAVEHGFDWVLTLDQDSVAAANLLEVYRHELQGKERLAMLTCDIIDRNGCTRKQLNEPHVDGYVPRCITSGCLLNVEAWRSVGGFDDSLFIDCVDHEICYHLIKDGWKIYRTYGTHILHELGHRRVFKVFGRETLTNNHAPFRHYYIARNRIVVARRYGKLARELYYMLKDFCKVWLFERQKCEKTKNIVRGMRDAFFRPNARYDPSKSGQPPDG